MIMLDIPLSSRVDAPRRFRTFCTYSLFLPLSLFLSHTRTQVRDRYVFDEGSRKSEGWTSSRNLLAKDNAGHAASSEEEDHSCRGELQSRDFTLVRTLSLSLSLTHAHTRTQVRIERLEEAETENKVKRHLPVHVH